MAVQRGPSKRGGVIVPWAVRAMALTTALLFMLPGTAGADWPVFGRDLGNSRDAGSGGPSAGEAAVLQRAWSFRSSHGDFTGTPVVAAGTLVAGTNLGTAFALRATDG